MSVLLITTTLAAAAAVAVAVVISAKISSMLYATVCATAATALTLVVPCWSGDGIGDDTHSYGYDGVRCKKFNGTNGSSSSSSGGSSDSKKGVSTSSTTSSSDVILEGDELAANYGQNWKAGDVAGCMLDIAAGTISYTLNGVHMGTAFQLQAHEQPQQKGKGKRKANAEAVDTAVGTTVDTTVIAAAYFPALSLEQGESVVINAAVLWHAHTALIRHAQCYESDINIQKRDERSSPAETTLPHALHSMQTVVADIRSAARKVPSDHSKIWQSNEYEYTLCTALAIQSVMLLLGLSTGAQQFAFAPPAGYTAVAAAWSTQHDVPAVNTQELLAAAAAAAAAQEDAVSTVASELSSASN
eukprot:20225-Heterococcus_DN1.PRE.1